MNEKLIKGYIETKHRTKEFSEKKQTMLLPEFYSLENSFNIIESFLKTFFLINKDQDKTLMISKLNELILNFEKVYTISENLESS